MKKVFYLAFLPFMLTGCLSKSVSKDKMKEVVLAAETNITEGNFDNVHAKDTNQYTYDYKEGNFFRSHMFALILVVPVTETICTWEQDGKYYHYEKHTTSSKDVDKEITKDEFDTYMAAHKATMKSLLMSPISQSKKLLEPENIPEEDPVKYETVKKESYKADMSGKTYTQKGTGVYKQSVYQNGGEQILEKEWSNTIKYTNNFPTEWSYNNDGKKKWNYSYGKAEFKNPKENN